MTAGAVLHVTFGPSAAGSLKQALALAGRTERVIWDDDDLGYGPIEPCTPDARAAFESDVLAHDVEPNDYAITVAFWDEAVSTDATVIAWFSRRCVRAYAGLHALVTRRHSPTLIVDVSDMPFTRADRRPSPDTSMCFGFVRHEQVVEHHLFDSARALPDIELARMRATWKRLTEENAPLRALVDGALVSVPIHHFDEQIVACVSNEWGPSARIVGDAWNRITVADYQASDTYVWSRLRDLEFEGVLEGRGDLSSMHDSELRLPARAD